MNTVWYFLWSFELFCWRKKNIFWSWLSVNKQLGTIPLSKRTYKYIDFFHVPISEIKVQPLWDSEVTVSLTMKAVCQGQPSGSSPECVFLIYSTTVEMNRVLPNFKFWNFLVIGSKRSTQQIQVAQIWQIPKIGLFSELTLGELDLQICFCMTEILNRSVWLWSYRSNFQCVWCWIWTLHIVFWSLYLTTSKMFCRCWLDLSRNLGLRKH